MLHIKNLLIFTILFFFFANTSAQNQNNKLDSLFYVTKFIKNDSLKINAYNKIAFNYIFNDTKKAIKVINKGKQIAKNKQLNYGFALLTNTHGILMDVTGKSDSAKHYFEKALKISQHYKFKKLEAKCVNNLGMFNWNKGNYNSALSYFFNSLKLNEAEHQEQATGIALNNIGLIYQEMSMNEKALNYHKKALKIREKYNLENEQIASLNNIGINLKELNKLNQAIIVYKKGIKLAKRKNNLIEYYRLLDNLANVYNIKGLTDLALKTYLKALKKPEHFDADKKSELFLLNNIAKLYNQKTTPKKALNYINKGFMLVNKYPEIQLIAADLYLTSAESNYMLNNFKVAIKHKKKFITLKDSIFSESNAKAIANLEIKYETEKKEKEILVQRAEIAEKELKINTKNYQLFGLITLILIFGFLSYLLYNQQKLKNNQLKKENELKNALLKIENQNHLQEQRLRISRDLHDNIGAQLTFIISSIDNLKYGFKIEDNKLNNKLLTISDFTKETICELRDTIWAMNKNEITILDLETRISNFIEKANLASVKTAFFFKTENEAIKDITLTSVEGMNMYRIIQEAVNNAIKYAEASKISIIISKKNKKLKIEIIDNGKGYDTNTITFGNGINNIKKRTADLNAEIVFTSQKNQGTQVILTKKI